MHVEPFERGDSDRNNVRLVGGFCQEARIHQLLVRLIIDVFVFSCIYEPCVLKGFHASEDITRDSSFTLFISVNSLRLFT